MHMGMEPEMSLEAAVIVAQKDIVDLQHEFDDLHKIVIGNGDPKEGLVVLSALQGRLVADLAVIVEANRVAIAEHKTVAHEDVRQGFWARLRFEVTKSVVVWTVVGILAFGVANVHVSIGAIPAR